MEERVARLEERQKHNETDLIEAKAKIANLENSYAVINLLSAQVQKLASAVDKLNERIERMEDKDKEKIELELKDKKSKNAQLGFNVINFVLLAFVSYALMRFGIR